MTKQPKSTEIWVVLLIGLYQLHFLNIADYAVVQETVEVLTPLKVVWAKGLVNAILRRYCREKSEILNCLTENQPFIFGHPEWLLKRIKKNWPSD